MAGREGDGSETGLRADSHADGHGGPSYGRGAALRDLRVDGTGGRPGVSRGAKEDGPSAEWIPRTGKIAAWTPSEGWWHMGEVVRLLCWRLVTVYRQQTLCSDVGVGHRAAVGCLPPRLRGCLLHRTSENNPSTHSGE